MSSNFSGSSHPSGSSSPAGSANISGWSIRNPIPTLVLFLVLTLAGLVSFGKLGVDLNPNIDFPAVIVTVNQPGAGPAEMETQITKPIEDAVAGLGDIDELRSTIADGSSTTVINFTLGIDIDRAMNDVRDAIARVRSDLPADAQDPIVRRFNFSGGAILTYTVSSDQRSVEELSDLVDRTISQEILTVSGVARVNRIGGVDPEVRVHLDPQQLDALGITATQVNDQIRAFERQPAQWSGHPGGTGAGLSHPGQRPHSRDPGQLSHRVTHGGTVPLSTLGTVAMTLEKFASRPISTTRQWWPFRCMRSTGSVLVTVEEGVTVAVARWMKPCRKTSNSN
jgi:multidrug efflux pump subunit AcrB